MAQTLMAHSPGLAKTIIIVPTEGPWVRASPVSLRCVLIKNINPSLVLVQPRKTRPFITERLLMGRKESIQTKQTLSLQVILCIIHPGWLELFS